jgi:hypothetical protein
VLLFQRCRRNPIAKKGPFSGRLGENFAAPLEMPGFFLNHGCKRKLVMCRYFVNLYWVNKWNCDFLRIKPWFPNSNWWEACCLMVCTNSSERDFLRQIFMPCYHPNCHHLFYTKSSLQGVVAVSFVPFWGGEGGCDEANNSEHNSFLCYGFFFFFFFSPCIRVWNSFQELQL